MKRRFLSLLTAFALCLTLIPTTAFADDEKRGEDVSPCSCETACTVDNMNKECPVCGAENAIPQNCGQYVLLRTEPAKTAAPREPMIRMAPQS